jgi:hypothetical protein
MKPRRRKARLAGRRALARRISTLRKRPLPLSHVGTPYHDPRPVPDASPCGEGREKRDVVCIWTVGTFVLLSAGTIDRGTRKHDWVVNVQRGHFSTYVRDCQHVWGIGMFPSLFPSRISRIHPHGLIGGADRGGNWEGDLKNDINW